MHQGGWWPKICSSITSSGSVPLGYCNKGLKYLRESMMKSKTLFKQNKNKSISTAVTDSLVLESLFDLTRYRNLSLSCSSKRAFSDWFTQKCRHSSESKFLKTRERKYLIILLHQLDFFSEDCLYLESGLEVSRKVRLSTYGLSIMAIRAQSASAADYLSSLSEY